MKNQKESKINIKVIDAEKKTPLPHGYTSIIIRVSQQGYIENSNFCVCCRREIPEGTIVCRDCLSNG